MYEVHTQTNSVENFVAGDFPIAREGFEAGSGGVKKFEPVGLADGKVVSLTEDTADTVIGIAVADAEEGELTVVYLTGEFFESALALPEGIGADDIRPLLRKQNIYLRSGK